MSSRQAHTSSLCFLTYENDMVLRKVPGKTHLARGIQLGLIEFVDSEDVDDIVDKATIT
jgi:hypothetical protein